MKSLWTPFQTLNPVSPDSFDALPGLAAFHRVSQPITRLLFIFPGTSLIHDMRHRPLLRPNVVEGEFSISPPKRQSIVFHREQPRELIIGHSPEQSTSPVNRQIPKKTAGGFARGIMPGSDRVRLLDPIDDLWKTPHRQIAHDTTGNRLVRPAQASNTGPQEPVWSEYRVRWGRRTKRVTPGWKQSTTGRPFPSPRREIAPIVNVGLRMRQ